MKRCSIDGCGNPHQARGWCNKHYQRWLSRGDPEKEDPRLYRGVLKTPIGEILPEKRVTASAGQKRYDRLMAEWMDEFDN